MPVYHVLIVEDEPDQAELIQIALNRSSQSYQITTVKSGTACLKTCGQMKYDAIILDYKLPDMSGLEVLAKLKQQEINTPVIIVTGQGDEKIAVETMKRGASDYVVKEQNYLTTLPKIILSVIERSKLQQQLREKEELLENIVNKANDIIFSLDKNFHFSFVNPKVKKLGYREADLIDTPFLHILSDKHHQNGIENILNNPREKNYELEFKDAYGKIHNQIVSFILTISKDNPDYRILGIAKDVTETLQLHHLIQESKNKLQTLFDSITDDIVVLNKNKRVVMANKKVASLRNTSPDRVLGMKCHSLHFCTDTPCENCIVDKTWQTHQSEFSEMAHNDRIYQLWTYPMFNLTNELEFVIEYSRDVTEQKNVERKLIQAEKLATIGLLASGVAHELRNPLNIIETARYYLQDVLKNGNSDIESKLNIINRNVIRSSNIINNLLEFSRHSTKDREKIDINLIIDKTLALIEKDLRSQNITVTKYYQEIPKAYLNLDSLKQVFLNIIINAIHAMPDGGDLEISTQFKNDHWNEVRFKDSGQGISKENINNIFTPFFTTKEQGKGTGLGMYVSHSIIQREGGDIMVDSEVGKGTTFTVVLPVAVDE